MATRRKTFRAGDFVTVAHPASMDPKKWPPSQVETVYFPGPVDNGRVVSMRDDHVALVEDLDRVDRNGHQSSQFVHTHYLTHKEP